MKIVKSEHKSVGITCDCICCGETFAYKSNLYMRLCYKDREGVCIKCVDLRDGLVVDFATHTYVLKAASEMTYNLESI